MPDSIYSYVPQYAAAQGARPTPRALVAWGVVAAGALVFFAALFAAPYAAAGGHFSLARSLYDGFGVICHQQPARSFHAWGMPLAVCARCAGLYAGFAAGAILYPLFRTLGRTDAPARRWLFLAAAPTSIDFLLGLSGLWENTHLSRSLTAALLGAVAALYVVPGAVDFAASRGRKLFRVRAARS
ncbi:MAG TPA: DUF2085 domain-containing protein [Pyrinomonadaceae bacterium]|nr:DUF2085 domain-containing protein [Pyrinomonadaceae bacterium]